MGEEKKAFEMYKTLQFSLMDEWWAQRQGQDNSEGPSKEISEFKSHKEIGLPSPKSVIALSKAIADDHDKIQAELVACREREAQLIQEKSELVEIVNNQKNALRNLEAQKSSLESRNSALEEKLSEQETTYAGKLAACDTIKKGLEIQVSDMQNKLSHAEKELSLCKPYTDLLSMFTEINRYPIEEQNSFKLVFKTLNSPIFFLLECGSKLKEVNDTLAREVAQKKILHIDMATKLFSYLIEQTNALYESPLYEKLSTSTGEGFCTDDHVKTNESLASGPISKVLVPGYKNRHGKTVFKAIVEVK